MLKKYWLILAILGVLGLFSVGAWAKETTEQPRVAKIILSMHQERQAENLFKMVKCPVCEGQNLAESHVDIAEDLKIMIRQELKLGKTEQEITQNLVTIYGDDILFLPPKTKKTFLLWFGPYLVMLLMALMAGHRHYRTKKPL